MSGPIASPHLVSAPLGLLMIAAATEIGAGAGHPGRWVPAGLGVLAVVAGIWLRSAAGLAVLTAAAAILVVDPGLGFVAMSGAAASGYLVTRHTDGRAGIETLATTTGFLLGFLLAAVIAALLPARFAWLPLLAPPLTVAVYLVVVQPFCYSSYSETVSYPVRPSIST